MVGKTCCCGCCSVRDGTRIIAILSLIYAAYGAGQQVHNLLIVTQNPKDIADSYPAPDEESRKKIEELFIEHQTGLTVFFAVMCLMALVQCILSGLLLSGAWTNRESHCRPWLYYNFFFFAVAVIFALCLTVLLLFVNFVFAIMFGFLVGICLALEGYFLNVVREYILEIRYGTGSAAQAGVVYAPGRPPHNMI